MSNFDVLLRDVDVNQHILCEASAGTGKTFTIEHLFIRRLLTAPRSAVRDIAVLTFTNAVADELVLRLSRALDKAIEDLRSKNEQAADYILAIIEKDSHLEAANTLEIARDELEFAAIDTIHGFCYRCLSEYATGVLKGDKGKFATGADVRFCIEEFFRVGLPNDICTQAELQVLLKSHKRSFGVLQEALTVSLWNDPKITVGSILELTDHLQSIPCSYTAEQITEGLLSCTEQFTGIKSRSGQLNEGVIESIEAFAKLATKPIGQEAIAACIKNPLFASELFSKPKAKSSGIVSPVLAFALTCEPYLVQLAHPDSIFERLRVACKKFVSRELERRGLYCLQELLIRMERDIQDSAFQRYLKKRFSCVIVDEFQDTDPHQWNIIQTLFVNNWQGVLYLVGDPKQAIYSFRQADVYCYMQAKNLENQSVVTLSKNFRSSPDLVTGLNTLFCGEHSSRLFMLPKLALSLDVPTILSGEKAKNLTSSTRGAIHFFRAQGSQGRKKNWPTDDLEHDCFYSFIAKELKVLTDSQLSYSSSAILVKDRYQAQKIEEYLKKRGIPAQSWRKKTIVNSPSHLFLERLIASLLRVRDRSTLIDLVLQAPFAYSSASCQQLRDDLEFWAEHVSYLLVLRNKYDDSNLAGLVHAFLQGVWPGTQKVMKELLWHDKEFLFDLELLVEECQGHTSSLESIQEYLNSLKGFLQSECDQLVGRNDPHKDAVQILTLHASKGLEFDVVFALGLANRTHAPDAHQDSLEVDCEKLRQFYVACTRAKQRLYLPVAIDEEGKEVKTGQKSPMELFLESIQQDQTLDWLVANSSGTITSSDCLPTADESQLVSAPSCQPKARVFLPQVFRPASYVLTSFSQLNTHARQVPHVQSDDELPSGTQAGTLFHELLREVFQHHIEPDASWLQRRLLGSVLEGFEQPVLAILHQALGVHLGAFSLADVDRKKCLVEVPFYSKEEGNRFVLGAVDLFFEHKDTFYLLDWKSNILENYTKNALQQEISSQGYTLQAKMYTAATLRHLGINQAKFGGFFFVFLRGLQNSETQGVVFIEANKGDFHA